MLIIYIHGATATSESFNYIREHVGGNDMVLNYDSADGFRNNFESFKDSIKDLDNIFFIAHSLGGIYALHLANAFPEKVIGAVTLSTPYGGSREADYAKYFVPFSRLMRDIGPHSEPMRLAAKIKITHPWTNVVTTKGSSPFILEQNDGIVTLNSMRHHSDDMELIEIDYNHYEVVMSPRTVDIIKTKMRIADVVQH